MLSLILIRISPNRLINQQVRMGQNLTRDKVNLKFSVSSNRAIQFEGYEYDIWIS